MSELAQWKSHKIVRAGKIIDFSPSAPLRVVVQDINGALCEIDMPDGAWNRGHPNLGDYIVIYDDGYKSWSPAKAFEEGYIGAMTRHRWSAPLRQSSELTIRTCEKCGLVWWSRHDWTLASGNPRQWGGGHWSEFYTEANPDVKLVKRPECQ